MKENVYQIRQIENGKEIQSILFAFSRYFPNLTNGEQQIMQLAKKLEQFGIVIAAEIGGAIIGFAAFYANDQIDRIAYLTLIAVNESVRGQHIGTILLDSVVELCITNGMKTLLLEVRKNNSGAIPFYEKLGFEKTGKGTHNTEYMMKQLQE